MDYKAATGEILAYLGWLALFQGDYGEAQRCFEESLVINREIEFRFGIAGSLNFLGLASLNQGNYEEAQGYIEQSLVLGRELNDISGIALGLRHLGWLAFLQNDLDAARTFFEESLALTRKHGSRAALPLSLIIMGQIVLNQGEAAEARPYFEESLALSRKMDDKLSIIYNLSGLAGLTARRWQILDQPEAAASLNLLARAARLSGAASALLTSIGAVMFRPFPELYRQNLELVKANLDPATFEAAFAEGQAMSFEEAAAYALAE
jgi:tetratricopeptide (TPR) repeat protein